MPPLPYCAPALGRSDAERQRKYGRPATGPAGRPALEKCKKPRTGRGFLRIDRGRADDPFRYIGFSTVCIPEAAASGIFLSGKGGNSSKFLEKSELLAKGLASSLFSGIIAELTKKKKGFPATFCRRNPSKKRQSGNRLT